MHDLRSTGIRPQDLENTYVTLPEGFHVRIEPTAVARPELIRFNHALAETLGLDAAAWTESDAVACYAGNQIPEGATPLAMAYAGHQFGHFNPSLGDGRAILLGELVTPDGARRDLHLKGSGRTPFSRGGDGRAALGPVLREYILGEAMHGLGIPTTRALAMVTTGETVYRDRLEAGAVLARVAASHVRVGTFEYFARRGQRDAVRTLADYVIARHDPACSEADNPYRALLESVVARQGALIAQWMLVGFIHGVMNTDNMAISGETIDYGPCAFMDAFNPGQVYSSIDHGGRYAYDQQPRIGYWNLMQLASCLLPLLDEDTDAAKQQAMAALDTYGEAFESAYQEGMRAKLGLQSVRAGDEALVEDLLRLMAERGADFTNSFRVLSALRLDPASEDLSASDRAQLEDLFGEFGGLQDWIQRWRARLAEEGQSDAERRAAMCAVNPAYIPRNHRVQEIIEAANASVRAESLDLALLDELLVAVSRPFEEHPDLLHLQRPPEPHEIVQRTFCGT